MKPLWIAPILLASATFCPAQVSTQYLDFGPLGLVNLAAHDTSGNVYVVGVLGGYTGIRVYKISPSGATLYRFDFGSGNGDYPAAAAVDGSGALYIAGATYGPASFPVVRSLLSFTPSAESGFVSKVDPSGSQLVFSTLLGGKAKSAVNSVTKSAVGGLALDAASNVYVTGWTTAPDFPITAGAYQTTGPTGAFMYGNDPAAVRSAFVTKIAASLDRIVYSTFLSGQHYSSQFESSYLGSSASFIGVDANGLATVAGSNEDGDNPSHFPVTPGAYGYGTNACCAFVTRLSADGGSLVWSALGVSGTAMDASGSVLSTGQADPALFQTTPGALQTTAPPNSLAGVLQKLSPDGSKLLASTFLGTATTEGLTFDPQGNIWAAGSCGSSGLLDFPSTQQPASAFFAEISPNLDRLVQSHLMPGYQDISVQPSANGSAVLVGNRGGLWLLPAGFASQPAVLDVSNSAASVYWAYVGDGTTVLPVTGSADWQYVSPGAFISIYGSNLGSADGLTAVYDRPGHIATSLGGVTVTLDGIPASLLYAGPGQINAIIPFAVAGQSSTVMRVQTSGGFSQSVTLPVIAATPFVFNTSQFEISPVYPNPGGPFASALNQDGTVNSATNPAKAGSVVTIFANGAGLYTQPLSDGTVNGSDLISPALPVGVYDTRHESNQPVVYAGTAPGLAAGVLQVNFQLASSTIGVDQYILIVGNYYSQPVDIYTAQ
jgi:uncharacterized protein (TIGR03437 family)